VDAIGGIDFDVDQPFRANDPTGKHMIEGKYYDKGMHHLDGKAVLGYLRIRKRADGKDSSRTARQRRMMVAIYKKLKTEGQLSQVPALINAANNGIYTNTTLSQTTSLVNYAMNSIEPEQIRTRAMSGEDMIQHYYKYCFVDQQNRINIIKEVFGIDAEPVGICTPQYENWLYDIGFKTMKHLRQPEKVFKVIEERKAAGKKFTEKQLSAYAACYQAYTDLDKGLAECSDRVQQAYLDSSMTKSKTKAVETDVKKQLNALNKKVKDTTTALAKACGIDTKLWWDVGDRWFADSDINEKRVHFG
jgi:Transcriptional regulator